MFFWFCNEIFLFNIKINTCNLAKIISLLGQQKMMSKAAAWGLLLAVSSEGSRGSGQSDPHELLGWSLNVAHFWEPPPSTPGSSGVGHGYHTKNLGTLNNSQALVYLSNRQDLVISVSERKANLLNAEYIQFIIHFGETQSAPCCAGQLLIYKIDYAFSKAISRDQLNCIHCH